MPKRLTARQKAGRINRKKWVGHSEAGLAALSQAAKDSRPWEKSTGPRTIMGKRVSRGNAFRHGGRAGVLLPVTIKDCLVALDLAERGEGLLPDAERVYGAMELLMAHEAASAQIRAASIICRYSRLIVDALQSQ